MKPRIQRCDFYVYAWIRPDTGNVFYIGKGKGGRGKTAKRDNPIFSRIIEKLKRLGLSPVVEKICENMSEADAFALEVAEISRHGRIDNGTGSLANLTDGGEGTSGHIRSDAEKARISASHTGKTRSTEHIANTSKNNRSRDPDVIEKNRSSHRRLPPSRGNTSGYKGVTFVTRLGKWRASIMIGNKRKYLGHFTNKEDAAMAYDTEASSAWGSDCYLNFHTNDNHPKSSPHHKAGEPHG